MKNKLTIFTLEGCSQCAKLKEELSVNRFYYNEINCTLENRDCNRLENLINCDIYPMCVLKSTNNTIILSLTDDYDKINTTNLIKSNECIIYLHSIDNMITIIKNN